MSETDSEPVSAIGSGFVRFRLQRIDLLRKGWHLLTLATVLSHLSLFVLLLLSLRHMGVSADTVTGAEALAAFVVAAVLIYRALSYLVYFPLSAWRLHHLAIEEIMASAVRPFNLMTTPVHTAGSRAGSRRPTALRP